MKNIQVLVVVAIVAFVAYSFLGDRGAQSADLGQVLDRTVYALENYDQHLKEKNVQTVGEEEMNTLASFMTELMNVDPKFYDQPLGVSLMHDATFLGYVDSNANRIQDDGEAKVFTVEIDSENKRLIATDVAGNGAHYGFSGSASWPVR